MKQLYLIRLLFSVLSYGVLSSTALQAQDVPVIPLWKNGAPGFENLKNKPEQAKDWWVRDINNPTLTVFLPPKEKANGSAVIVCPGGGFTNLVYNAEGKDAAEFLNSIGVTAFVLKYRLFREPNSPYSMENVKQDIFRAMRLAKSLAGNYAIDTARLGVMGFSAGGEVSGWLSYHFNENHSNNSDEIDRIPARPAFQILIYPGPLAVPDSVSADAPPTFLLAANEDPCCSESIVRLLLLHRKAKVPVEMHLYQNGTHAFNMGKRSEFVTLKNWPQRLADWMQDGGRLSAPYSAAIERQFNKIESDIVSTAEAMPEDKFNFTPESLHIKSGELKGVRSFAGQIKHLATDNFAIWSPVAGESLRADITDVNGPAAIQSKTDIMQYLKESFALGRRAMHTLTEKNAMEMIAFRGRQLARLDLMFYALTHANEHYGQMAVYLRMCGIVPPPTVNER
jgi:acetyl esterase/lipase